MTVARAAGVVVDTMVISWLFDDRPNSVADRYRTLIDATTRAARVPDGHGAALWSVARRLGRAASPSAGTTSR